VGGLAGCSSNVFLSNFEADTPGEDPLTSPPGPPSGDSVFVVHGDDVGGLNNVTITTSGALIDEQSLLLEGPTGGVTPLVGFIAAPVSNLDRPVTFDYTGRLSDGGSVRICVGTDAPNCVLVVRLTEDGDVVVNDVTVGSYVPQGTHRVLFTLFPSLGSFSFAMTGDATIEDKEAAAGFLPQLEDFPGDTMSLSLRLENAGSGDTYLVDNVRISLRD
jgi:hypothetical protein